MLQYIVSLMMLSGFIYIAVNIIIYLLGVK